MVLDIAIIGGGLVGALEACLLAKRGFNVSIFEARHDGRNEESFYGRSINLAISHRGISALERLNLENIVWQRAIPMKARMIHSFNGKTHAIPYDPDGRCINSIERAGLNTFLLDMAEIEFKVKIYFNHRLVDMDVNKGELFFRVGNQVDQTNFSLLMYKFDLILGCDGSRSMVRSLVSRQAPINVKQTFIEHGYIELRIDPNDDSEEKYKMPPNYLHIWPRGHYMMIALPNKDYSFTCTLFMPLEILKKLSNPDEALRFFRENFSDSVKLIGEERIKNTLSTTRANSLISIECNKYHLKHRVVLLGDAAHAMVPFYGQGMNCGFEDCLVLDELLDEFSLKSDNQTMMTKNEFHSSLNASVMEKILSEYDRRRCPNGQAMCNLAMYNYIEMRDLVNTWSFMIRKKLDNILYRIFPRKWVPLYTMVTFTRIPIHKCIEIRETQDKILKRFFKISLVFGIIGLIFGRVAR